MPASRITTPVALLLLLLTVVCCSPEKKGRKQHPVQKAEGRQSAPNTARDSIMPRLTAISADTYRRYHGAYQNPLVHDSLRYKVEAGRLAIPTEKGSVVFTDNTGIPYDENEELHTYYGYLPPLKKHIVHLQEYEGHAFLLVDSASGRIDTIGGLPLLSPNGKHLFASQYNGYETYPDIPPPTEDVELWKIDGTDLKFLVAKPYQWALREAYWLDARTIHIKAASLDLDRPLYWRLEF